MTEEKREVGGHQALTQDVLTVTRLVTGKHIFEMRGAWTMAWKRAIQEILLDEEV